jgi:hypothetical protein
MNAITLVVLLLAPIPKTTYEGQIAIAYRSPKPTIVLIKPNGQEVRRVELADQTNLYTIKNSRNSEYALVTNNLSAVQIGNRYYSAADGYLVKWDGSAKPKKLVDGRIGLKWTLNRDATKIFATESDREKLADDTTATKGFEITIATGKEKEVAIPKGHSIIDVTHDDQFAVLMQFDKSLYKTKLVATADWKEQAFAGDNLYPHGISPDGRKILATDYSKDANNRQRTEMVVVDRETKSKVIIAKPDEIQAISAYSFGADGKRMAFAGYTQNQQDNGQILLVYRVYVANVDGSNIKKIFETQPGEQISDIDWR